MPKESRSGYVSSNGPGRLHFLVGLPCSGKSTFANRWACYADEDASSRVLEVLTKYRQDGTVSLPLRPRVVIAGDDFREGLHGKEYLPTAEPFVFATMDAAARALLLRGYDVLIDETSTTYWTLTRYLKVDLDASPIFIDTPVEECKRRALEAGRDYLVPHIERMHTPLTMMRHNWHEAFGRLREETCQRNQQDIEK